LAALTVAALAWGGRPAQVLGAQTATLEVALSPARLGHETTIEFGFRIFAPSRAVPSPMTGVELAYPRHLGIATSGLGVATCSRTALEEIGATACPANSRMGFGSALAEIQDGPVILRETAAISIFMAPVQSGSISLLFFADAESPISAQIAFPGTLLPARAPFGGVLAITLPLIPSVPEAPDVAVMRLRSTIGPRGITYYERAHGKRKRYRPKGIVLPSSCPRRGFPFAALFSFADGSSTIAHATVPCPRARHAKIGPSGSARRGDHAR
jgi:hypothetical protein